jgi:tyrosine-protein kinase
MDGETSLRRHLTVLRRAWKVIVAFVAVGLVVAFAVNTITPRVYESQALLNVGPVFDQPEPDINVIIAAQRVAATYASFAQTRSFLEQVRADGHLEESVDDLQRKVSAIATPESLYIQISFQDADPAAAARAANAIANGLVDIAPTSADPKTGIGKQIRLVDPAVAASEPVAPRTSLNLLVGLIAGILAGLAVAYGRAYLRDEVDDARDAEDLAQVPVLGRVHVDDGSADPEDREALAWLAKRIELLDGGGSRIVLTPASPAAVGWLGAAIGERYAATGLSTLLVRLDRSSRITTEAGAAGFDQLLGGGTLDARALSRPIGDPNLRLLAGGVALEAAAERASRERAASAIASLARLAEVSVIVTDPPSESLATLLLAPEGSSVVLVVDAAHARRRDVASAAATLRQVGARLVGVALVDGAEPSWSQFAASAAGTTPGLPAHRADNSPSR